MVDTIAEFLASLPDRTVTPGKFPSEIRKILGSPPLPQSGAEPGDLLEEAAAVARIVTEMPAAGAFPFHWGGA